MTPILREVYPDARFIHLHRDAREVIASMRSKPPSLTWDSGRPRYTSPRLTGGTERPLLERMCNYWTNYNDAIRNDLSDVDYLSMKFTDLIGGKVEPLESFMNLEFKVKKLPPVNADKPVRKEGAAKPFEQWPSDEQELFWKICGPTMKALGYE